MARGKRFFETLAYELMEVASDGFVVSDVSGTIVSLNPAAVAMFGWKREELVGQPVESLVPERFRAPHAEHHARVAKQRRARTVEAKAVLHGLRRDGTEFPIDIALSSVETPEGRFIVASMRDVTRRERAVDALERSETRWRDLVEHAPDGILIANQEGHYTEVNTAACRMLGYTRHELLGKTIADVVVPEEMPRLLAEQQSLAEKGGVRVTEWTARRKDGTRFAVEVSAKRIATGWQAFLRDVSERKAHEGALRATEASLRRAQSVAQLGSWDWDLVQDTVWRSPQLYAIFGVDPSTAPPPLALLALVPESEREATISEIRRAIAEGRSYRVEHRIVRPDGEERIVLEQGETVMRDGKPVRATGTTLDITELRRAERERATALAELEAVLEQCPVGITIARGPSAEQLEPNRKARQMQGEPFDPAVGMSQYRGALVDSDGVEVPFDRFPAIRALRGERVERQELVFRRPDGSEIPIEVNAAPVAAADGRTMTAVVVWEDISAAREVERLRAEWNSVVAHDLRQPINTINLYAQLLARAADQGQREGKSGQWLAEAVGHIAEIRRMIARLTRMTNDLLDLSRLDASRLTVQRRPFDVAAGVRGSVSHASLGSPERAFEVETDADLPEVEADPDRIAQVLENLLSNALKYGRSDAPVRVAVRRAGDGVSVAVTSQGAGLDAKDLERIFEKFQRAGVAAHRAIPGIGLGLQITQGLVHAHGGSITATSSASGETTFRFTLPRG